MRNDPRCQPGVVGEALGGFGLLAEPAEKGEDLFEEVEECLDHDVSPLCDETDLPLVPAPELPD